LAAEAANRARDRPHSAAAPPAVTVLLCYDGSDSARHAIQTAARAVVERDAVVLTVWTPAAAMTPLDPFGDAVGGMSGIYAELDATGKQLAGEQGDDGARLAREAGFEARPRTEQGRAWSTIVEVAAELEATVVVMGARGHSAPGGLLGSVSERVVRHSRQPVLIVPAAS